jgi:hypothetical protein
VKERKKEEGNIKWKENRIYEKMAETKREKSAA